MTHDEIIYDKGYWAGTKHAEKYYKDLIKEKLVLEKSKKTRKQIAEECGGSYDCYEKQVTYRQGYNQAIKDLEYLKENL